MDHPLYELEEMLDPRQFFRLNRKYIARIDSIDQFTSYEKGKLLIELRPKVSEKVIVSQEKAGAFKKWLEG